MIEVDKKRRCALINNLHTPYTPRSSYTTSGGVQFGYSEGLLILLNLRYERRHSSVCIQYRIAFLPAIIGQHCNSSRVYDSRHFGGHCVQVGEAVWMKFGPQHPCVLPARPACPHSIEHLIQMILTKSCGDRY